MSVYRALCNATESTHYVARALISIFASGVASLICSPVFLIKSRMQLEETRMSNHYNTFRGGVRHVVQSSGLRGLWRGVSLQLLLIIPNALGIPTYDLLKSGVLQYKLRHGASPEDELNIVEVCVCSALTKCLLLLLSHPMVMIRTRIQDQRALEGERQYTKVVQSARLVLRTQGITGMYRGFHLALIHSLPRSLFYYVAYEKTLYALTKWQA
ncbi:solute carrier family 25 (mitochondrial folate transporter), member 32 [Strigomonas culicis]|uniref:Solute carrier family 25 (Mitochondrial folate transporter), member 32 n=1 Tax=Strigomonas culicis TaxID=28005 RepID=S9V5R0_9TRYP|nr:solute carrier family 25 (mitochondrial folate transporter), member 32 [Strigomonas culicis]|eukprot:EPY22276.1 solute carrier family 25 (mitochondrial folate transporter), member 32 [Strigomonas culicis]